MNTENNKRRKAVLLLNVGTPDSPEVGSVRKYLTEFLNDPYVINLPWLFRKILVNLIIVPFRAPKSAKLYKQLWENEGSPLLSNTKKLQKKLAVKIGEDYEVFFAMRYGNPSIKSVLNEIAYKNFEELVVLPLFPQFALSTTETAIQSVYKEVKKFNKFPEIRIIKQFYNYNEFINAWAARAKEYDLVNFEHVIFSFHGLPLSHIAKAHPKIDSLKCNCNSEMPEYGMFCYKASCYETTRLIAEKLGLKKDQFSVSFQSRLTKNWLSPFTDDNIKNLAKQDKKSILIFAPSFVADCLETTVEIGIEYVELFRKSGGEKLVLVESLNDGEEWIIALEKIIKSQNEND